MIKPMVQTIDCSLYELRRLNSLNTPPHNKTVCREFDVHAWLEPELNYIESVEFPKHLRLGGVEG